MEAQTSLDALGDRLRSAIEAWSVRRGHTKGSRGAIRVFQEAVARRLRGSGERSGDSYRAIMSYLGGSSTPSLEWLTTAADLLGVRIAWLLTGAGYRTREEELVGARIGEAAQRAFEALRSTVAEGTGRPDVTADTVRDVLELAQAYATRRGRRGDDPAGVYGDVARAVVAPLVTLGLPAGDLSAPAFRHYLKAMTETLRFTVAEATHTSE